MLEHLADVSVQALVPMAIAAAVLWRKRSAAMQHAVWSIVVLGMLGLFIFGPALPKMPIVVETRPAVPVRLAAPPAARTAFYATQPEFVSVTPMARVQPNPRRIGWSEVASDLYVCIAGAFLLRFAIGMLLAWKLARNSSRAGKFFESASIQVPLTVGWVWPRILLPMSWREWDREKLEAVLAHEGTHVRRRDGLIAALAGVNRCIFWFHPLAWWIERRLGLLAELACDEACVAELGDRQRYANLLLEMARTVDRSHRRVRAFSMAASSHLGQRIESILKGTPSKGLKWTAWAAIGLCGTPVVLAAGTVAFDGPTPLPPLLMFQRPPYVPYATPPPPPPPPPPPSGGRMLLAQAQTAPAAAPRQGTPLKFEVASIRPAGSGGGPPASPPPPGPGALPPPPPPPGGAGCFTNISADGERLDWQCVSLRDLLLEVFELPVGRLIAPDWIGATRFDVSAKLPPGATPEQVPSMLEALLEDRFGLAFHRESKAGPVNFLTVAKGGPKLRPAAPESAQPGWVAAATAAVKSQKGHIGGIWFRSIVTPGPDGLPASVWEAPGLGFVRRTDSGGLSGIVHYEAPSITSGGLAALATLAGNGLDSPVLDRTGLTGRYQANLDVSMADLIAEVRANPGDVEAVHRAELGVVQDGLKKLGLELRSQKMPVEVIVIDHLEKTPTAN